ncbi:MAG: DUF1559 domain-containing protein [Planctomycetaceae bacterium]|nr:DUF1559 domain-containing protein [Planctomycetaceae bacterium]
MNRGEVIVVVLCVSILIVLGGPFILASRKSARDQACVRNLQAMGVNFYAHADKDAKGRLCTGATDWLRDGCPTNYGWVADLMRISGEKPSFLQCPSNTVKGPEMLNDLIGHPTGPPRPRLPKELWNRYDKPDCNAFALQNVPSQQIGTLEAGSPERIGYVENLVSQGLATNYVPSWFLVRSSFTLQGDEHGNAVLPSEWSVTEVGGSQGPLTVRQLETSKIPSSLFPLMADAAPRSGERGKLSQALKGVGPKGTPLGASLTGGPIYYHPKRNVFVSLLPGKIIVPKDLAKEWHRPFCEDRYPTYGKPGDPGMDGKLWMQDTRQWKALHGQGEKKIAHILMADGSVKAITDRNGDGYINPGFPVQKPTATYRDDTVETTVFEVYLSACVPYWGYMPKGTFE